MGRAAWSTDELIDGFCQAIAKGFAGRSREPGIDLWPQPVFSPFEGDYYVHSFLIPKLHLILRKLERRGMSLDEISRLFHFPSRVAILTYLFAHDSTDRREVAQRIEVAKQLIRIITILRNGDPFCESGKNNCLSVEAVNSILSSKRFEDIGSLDKAELIRRSVSKLIVALRGYCELVYFAGLSAAMEVHGPYRAGNGSLLVREYYDLKPSFWEFTPHLPFGNIVLYTIYPALIDVTFDYSGRLISREPLGPMLTDVRLEVDSKPLEVRGDFLDQILESVSEVVRIAIQEIKSLEKTELVEKWVESKFWSLRPLAECTGDDWQPPREVYEKIRLETADPWIGEVLRKIQGLGTEGRKHVMAKLFDPRLLNKKHMLLS